MLLLLELLLSKRQPTLKLLHHVVALLLLIDELLVKDLIDARYWLFYLREHYLQLPLQLGHYLVRHCLLELVVNNFAHLGVCKLRSPGDSCHRRRECCGLLWATYRGLYRGGCPSQSLELRLNARNQGRPDLLVKQLGLLLHQRCNSILHLLLDDFGKGCLDSLRDGLLNLNLQVLLRLHLLLQAVHFHVQLRELLVQFLVVLNNLILLLLFCRRDINSSSSLPCALALILRGLFLPVLLGLFIRGSSSCLHTR